MDIQQFEGRKRDHIQHALNPAHQADGLGGLDRVHLVHDALTDLNFDEIRLDSVCLGSPSPTPFYIAGMTAGHADAPRVNQVLAEACQERGWAMGVGSQRRELIESAASVDHWKSLRREVPRLKLYANLGISQLIVTPLDQIRRVVDSIQAQALMVHLNALQEVMQPEGTPQFAGGLRTLEKLCTQLGVPIVLKETGCGFSTATLRRVRDIGLAGVDVSGLGGTHWGRIEGARAAEGSVFLEASRTFANWGESTVDSVIAASSELREGTEIWASGGVRTGLDSAKLMALGAHQIGFAQPALQAALKGGDQLRGWMSAREYELRVALFCTGCKDTSQLRLKEEVVWKTNVV